MVIGEGQSYLAVLLTLHTNIDEKSKQPGKVLSDDAQRWFKNTRYTQHKFAAQRIINLVENFSFNLDEIRELFCIFFNPVQVQNGNS